MLRTVLSALALVAISACGVNAEQAQTPASAAHRSSQAVTSGGTSTT